MRSITRLKNLPGLFALLVITGGVLLHACRKTNDMQNVLSENFTSASVKEWYYSTFKYSSEWTASPEHGKKIPMWKAGVQVKVAGWDAMEYPLIRSNPAYSLPGNSGLSIQQSKRIANASLSKIFFIKEKDDHIAVREVDYIPDWQYLERKNFIINQVGPNRMGDFTGRMVIKKWDGSIVSTLKVAGGKIIKKGRRSEAPVGSTPASASYGEECTSIEYCIWQADCVITFDGDGQILSDECGEEYNTGECWIETECTGGGDECEDFGVNCPEGGGGGGGSSSGGGGVQEALNQFDQRILDSLSNCRSAILVDLKNLSPGKIASMIHKFSSNIPGFNWKVVESDRTSDPNANATTEEVRSEGYVLTTLNTTNLSNATDLFVARTMLHEGIHAYLVSYYYNDPNAGVMNYKQLYDYYVFQKYPNANDPHHAIMADSLIHDISSALQSYAIANGYTNNAALRNACDQLAWGGLEGTSAFANLSSYDQADIIDRNTAEMNSQSVGNATLIGTKACP